MTTVKYSYDNNNTTSIKFMIGKQEWYFEGFSRAGLKTSIVCPQINTIFDAGDMSPLAAAQDNMLISHGHMDHLGSLHFAHSSRKLNKNDKQRIVVMPDQCIVPFKHIAAAFSEMNSGRNTKNIHPLEHMVNTTIISSEEISSHETMTDLINTGSYCVKSILMDHKVKSFGYIIYMKSNRLKPEYIRLSGKEIKQLKETVGCITYMHFTPLIAYTGDTSIKGLHMNPELFTVPILIMECTGFSPEDHIITKKGGHIHWNELLERSHLFKNDKIILFHFSQQYKKIEDIMPYIESAPADFLEKIIFFM
jgi:ribonuclease Z